MNAKLRIGEEEELSRIKETLKNKDKIIRLLNMRRNIVFFRFCSSACFCTMQALYSVSALDNRFEELYKRMNSLYYEAEECNIL